jgi:hypothetical protein
MGRRQRLGTKVGKQRTIRDAMNFAQAGPSPGVAMQCKFVDASSRPSVRTRTRQAASVHFLEDQMSDEGEPVMRLA